MQIVIRSVAGPQVRDISFTDCGVRSSRRHDETADLGRALATDKLDEMEALNKEFHALLYREGHAPRLAWLNRVIHLYIPSRFYARVAGWAESVVEDHERIVESVKARNLEAARLAMSDHIRRGGIAFVSHLDRIDFWSDDGHIAVDEKLAKPLETN